MKQRKELAERDIPGLSKRRRCALLGVNISSLYLKKAEEKEEKVTLMNDIQTLYAHRPTKGYRRICFDLTDIGYVINKKRVLRVMQEMGLQAIYPKKNLSKRRQEDAVHPYLLKALPPLAVHDCWC